MTGTDTPQQAATAPDAVTSEGRDVADSPAILVAKVLFGRLEQSLLPKHLKYAEFLIQQGMKAYAAGYSDSAMQRLVPRLAVSVEQYNLLLISDLRIFAFGMQKGGGYAAIVKADSDDAFDAILDRARAIISSRQQDRRDERLVDPRILKRLSDVGCIYGIDDTIEALRGLVPTEAWSVELSVGVSIGNMQRYWFQVRNSRDVSVWVRANNELDSTIVLARFKSILEERQSADSTRAGEIQAPE